MGGGPMASSFFVSQRGHGEVGSSLILVGIGLFIFFHYGLTKYPLEFNDFMFRRKPLSVRAARLIYIPLGLYSIYWGIQGVMESLKW
jgi:hypothetical protein